MHRFAKSIPAIFSLLIFANFTFAQPDTIYRLPAGTRLKVAVDAEVSSGVASVNDTFIASTVEPVRVQDTVMLPIGTPVEARITAVTRATTGGRYGKLDVIFETLKVSNASRKIDGVMITRMHESSSDSFGVLSVLGGLAAGAAIGSTSSTRGTLIGAGLGSAVGTGIALLRKGKEARIRKGEEFEIELKRDVLLPVIDY